MGERNTALLLEEWGKWIWEGGGVDLGMRSALASLVPAKRRDYVPSVITDIEAGEVDIIIATLRKTRPLMARVLYLEFAFGYSVRKMATVMNLSREEASRMSGRAIGLVDCALNPSDVFTQSDLEELVELLKAA